MMASEAKISFRDVPIGARFVFAAEVDGVGGLRWQGARGPWVKTSARQYVAAGDAGPRHTVGTVNVKCYLSNPRPRLGTKKPLRASSATGRKPTKRLVSRRKRNSRKGYFPNPAKRATGVPEGLAHKVGDRVEISPGYDAWMRGDRYGEVEKITAKMTWVRLDKSRRILKIPHYRHTGIYRVLDRDKNPAKRKPRGIPRYVVTNMRGENLREFHTVARAVRWAKAYAKRHGVKLRVIDSQ